MNTKILKAIATKDILEVKQNKAAWMPMVIVPLIFVLLIPLGLILIPQFLDIPIDEFLADPDLEIFLANMPPSLQQTLEGLDPIQSALVMALGYMFAPLFLIFPLMFSTVIAAESFAGERERKTMEALLYTPATDSELFMGKVLAAFIPALILTWGSFFGYMIVVNAASFPLFGRIWFPLPSWWPLMFWIAPALALLGISATVLISVRNQTFMGAYQLSSSLLWSW
ncbi:MAG: ABC transporter permease subunit [Anaerolineaceae bacterium]|nr:ABC transporter permease subunit [Anaerolineaceae bacterium]